MAKCKLDVDNPKFCILGDANSADLKSGLKELQGKVIRDHRLSGWVCQPMPDFPDYHNKIWKWDFAPRGDKSRTRKGWRLFAHVENPESPEPIFAQAFLCYDKDQQPKGQYVPFIVEKLKEFLSKTIKVVPTEDRFRRVEDRNGKIYSTCLECCDTVESENHSDADINESLHECQAKPI